MEMREESWEANPAKLMSVLKVRIDLCVCLNLFSSLHPLKVQACYPWHMTDLSVLSRIVSK